MSDTDGERIAPVTYLFGAQPAVEETEMLSPSVVTSSDAAAFDEPGPDVSRGPRFVDLGAEADLTPEANDRVAAEPRNRKGDFDRISNVSMYALARRGMSSREMRDYLIGRDFDPADVDEEVARLEGVALLDDAALAETLLRTLRDRKGLGRSAVNAELRRRHLDPEAIEGALESVVDDELARATELAQKRAPQLRSLDSATAKRRLGAFLMRKGYSGQVVGAAVQRALEPSGPVFR